MKVIALRLAQEELDQIESLAGIGYGPEKIAMYLDVAKKDFMKDWQNPETLIRYHYDRGVLLVDAAAGTKLAENAMGGNITAHQQLEKIKRRQFVEDAKNRILYGEETH